MNRILSMNGKQYRINRLTDLNGIPACVADFLYKGKWHEVKNYQIIIDLRKLYDARSRKQYAKRAREKAIQQSMSYGYNRQTAEQSFDAVTEMVYTKYQAIDEYSPIIRHANECLYACGMLDRILTAEDLKALGVS